MKNKKLAASFFLSAVIHIAVLLFLFSFQSSKPLPDSDAPVSLVSLVSPQNDPQKANEQATKTENLPKAQTRTQEIPQNIDVNENGRIISAPTNTNNENFDVGANIIRPSTNENNEQSENNFTLTTPPRTLFMPQIPYPRAAKSAKIEGVAEILYTIDERGRVVSVEILSVPHPSFENVIRRAVLSWRFSPATENGKPVSIKATKTIVFKLAN